MLLSGLSLLFFFCCFHAFILLQLIVVNGCHWMLFVPQTSNPFNLNIERKRGMQCIENFNLPVTQKWKISYPGCPKLSTIQYSFTVYALCRIHNKSQAENPFQRKIYYKTEDRLLSYCIASSADIKWSMRRNAIMYLDRRRMRFVCSYLSFHLPQFNGKVNKLASVEGVFVIANVYRKPNPNIQRFIEYGH